MELKTGAVKVMASKPSFDPNADNCGANRNVATQDRFPPGSTMKVVTAAAALDSGKFEPDSQVDGSNGKEISGAPLDNFGGEDFGQIDLRTALTNSVNTVWASVAEDLGKETMAEYMEKFGFYEDPPMDYPDEQMIPSGVNKGGRRLVKPTSDRVDIGRVAIGQGDLEATTLQMASVAQTIGNEGVRMKPRLVAKIVDPDGRTVDEPLPEEAERVVSERDRERAERHDAQRGRAGHGHLRPPRGRRGVGQDGHRRGQQQRPQRRVVHRLHRPLRRRGRDRARPGRDGRRARRADRRQGPQVARRELIVMQRIDRDTIIDERYRVLNRLGSGGMADVYCAEDLQLGRNVAVKLLYRRFAEDSEFVERFRREASSAAGLQHPNIVGVFDRGEWDGTYYIAMEYLKGHTLKQLVRDHGAMPPDLAVDITIQVLRAAKFAHKRGVVHRDIKPHNVILDEEGRAKVTDFGIARAGASDMTETGSIMGTAQYLSPEQAQGQPVSPRSDLYSIGVMLYELLTGQVPFDAESAVTIALKHVSEPPSPPSQLNPAVPPALDAVVLRALEKDPALRFADADEFAAALLDARERPTVVAAREVQLEPYPMPGEPFVEEERRAARAGGCGCCSRCC